MRACATHLSTLAITGWLPVFSTAACGSRSGLDGLDVLPDRDRLEVEPRDEAPEFSAIEPPPERMGCVDLTRSYVSLPPTVMLLIDQSYSMSFPFGSSTRWEVLRQAIVDPERGLLASLDAGARIGLMLYTGQNGYASPLGCPIITEVGVQLGNVDAVRSAYLAAEPMQRGDTPTGESIAQAALALGGVTSGAPKYILLATDGQPDTCAQPKPQEGLPEALAAAASAFAEGIHVRVLGVSDGLDAWRLQQLANAGAGKDPSLEYGRDADAEPPLSASTDPRDLADQLRGIIGDQRSCAIELGTSVEADRELQGRVALDGQLLPNDTRDGWTLVDDGTLQVHGAACEKILADGERLEVRFPCDDAPAAPPR